MAITRTAITDDDGTGTTGTIINNAWKTELYDQIDAFAVPLAGGTMTGALTTNGQIVFPATQNASSNANTLDDYEEGTWTPVIGGSGGTSGQTYGGQQGFYVKVGKLVMCTCNVSLTAKGTITGNVQIQGLPFANDTNAFSTGTVEWLSLATNWVNVIVAFSASGTTALEVRGCTAAAATNSTALLTADINNTSQFLFSIVYRASA